MKIQPLNPNIPNNTNFKASKIARISTELKGRGISEIDIYSIDRDDYSFLKKLAKRIDYKKLFPKLTEQLQARWQKVFNYCIECATSPENTTYIAIHNNKPCGILTSYQDRAFSLDGLCTIPQKTNQKVPFVGTSLIFQLFKDAERAGASEINLDAVTDGPFDVVTKYEKLGFKKDPTSVQYAKMRCNKHKIKEQLRELPFKHTYTKLDGERVYLEDFLD